MQRLPSDLSDPIAKVIAESAQAVWADAVQRVPVDTGALRDSIGIRLTPASAEVGFDAKKFRKEWKRAGWRAVFIEKGTKGSAKRNIPPMAARPFLRPAFEVNQKWIMERHRKAVAQVLARASSL